MSTKRYIYSEADANGLRSLAGISNVMFTAPLWADFSLDETVDMVQRLNHYANGCSSGMSQLELNQIVHQFAAAVERCAHLEQKARNQREAIRQLERALRVAKGGVA